jgi:BirA family biotin operon repressor/biotin-[acetyl-CoA-carboxylase] ligase
MIILTDTIDYTSQILNEGLQWKKKKIVNLTENIQSLAASLFYKSYIKQTSLNQDTLWKYLFICNFAPKSQFQLLQELNRRNTTLSDGIICLARTGNNFRGYKNRSWSTEPGNLHICIYLEPNLPIRFFHIGLTIVATVSLIQTLDTINSLQDKAQIKWVNDIVIDKAKVGGVITYTQAQGTTVKAVVMGIGINVNITPNITLDPFVPEITSLKENVSDINLCNLKLVFSRLMNNIAINYRHLREGRFLEILEIYKKRSIIIGKPVSIYSDPYSGEPKFKAKGRVLSIGDNLELYIEGIDEPIKSGRVILQ